MSRERHRLSRLLLPLVGVAVALAGASGMAFASVPPTEPTAPAPTEPTPTEPTTTEPVATTEPAPTEPTTAEPTTSATPPTTAPATTSPATTVPESTTTTTTVAPAPVVDIALAPRCTSAEDFAAGTRTFRVDNNGGEAVDVTLRNVDAGGEVSGTAPPGSSTWNVPAGDGRNRTEVVVEGVTVASADAINLMCAALHGHAECDTTSGTTTIEWTVSNNDGSPVIVVGSARGLEYSPNPDAPHGGSTATELIDGPAEDQQLTETVTVELAGGGTSEYSAGVTAAACTGPELPADVSFTFSKTASVAMAAVGDEVEYVYCGRNTSGIPLEVVRLVDDRLGVVIELPDVETVVGPGETLCNTDIGQPISYTVALSDLGTTITNHAVVTVRTQEDPPRVFQASATAGVRVPLARLREAIQDGDKTWVCHRTLSTDNPYNKITVSTSSTDASGHVNHAEDIIPPGAWGPGQNYDPANGGIWLNECKNITVLPVAPSLTQATCVDGAVVPPHVTPATLPLGVHYTVSPAVLGDGTTDVPVTVTATLVLGYEWGPMPAGWIQVDATKATWTGLLTGTTCSEVRPVDPDVTQARCALGVLNPPTLTPVPTDNITYTVNPEGPYRAGDTVTVTATLAQGFAWPDVLPPLWIETSATTATFMVTFDDVSCIEVTPVRPQVAQATCANGVVVPPLVTTDDTDDGVLYAVIPSELRGRHNGRRGQRDGHGDRRLRLDRSVAGRLDGDRGSRHHQVHGHAARRDMSGGHARGPECDPGRVREWRGVGSDADGAARHCRDHLLRRLNRPVRAGPVGDRDGHVGPDRGWLAGDVAGGLEQDLDDDGDLRRDLRSCVLHARDTGGPSGGSGDVRQRRGHRADDRTSAQDRPRLRARTAGAL